MMTGASYRPFSPVAALIFSDHPLVRHDDEFQG